MTSPTSISRNVRATRRDSTSTTGGRFNRFDRSRRLVAREISPACRTTLKSRRARRATGALFGVGGRDQLVPLETGRAVVIPRVGSCNSGGSGPRHRPHMTLSRSSRPWTPTSAGAVHRRLADVLRITCRVRKASSTRAARRRNVGAAHRAATSIVARAAARSRYGRVAPGTRPSAKSGPAQPPRSGRPPRRAAAGSSRPSGRRASPRHVPQVPQPLIHRLEAFGVVGPFHRLP